MANLSYAETASLFKALAHPARLQMLNLLREGELCVCHLERTLGKRQAYISQQLMVLRDAGLVASRKEGLSVYYRIADDAVLALLEATFGPVPDTWPELIPGCPCPLCCPE